MRLRERLLDHSVFYSLWQAPFAERKFRPFLAHNPPETYGRVLDVGCGPGTNAQYFRGADYTGIDLNPAYVARARRRYGLKFIAADAVAHEYGEEKYDTILINSFLHHLDDEQTDTMLRRLSGLLTPGGHIHVLEPETVPYRSAARLMERLDRGDHFRPLAAWSGLLARYFDIAVVERFDLGMPGIPLWRMIYFKGRRAST
jgi:trans-aconitate methyltransferase